MTQIKLCYNVQIKKIQKYAFIASISFNSTDRDIENADDNLGKLR